MLHACFNLQDQTLLLDPPSLIFILRLHLLSVARRKVAAAGTAGHSGQGFRRGGGSEAPGGKNLSRLERLAQKVAEEKAEKQRAKEAVSRHGRAALKSCGVAV